MKIKTNREFSGVPKGTIGTAELEKDGLWKITWDLETLPDGRPRMKPLVDWFSKEDKELFLEEV